MNFSRNAIILKRRFIPEISAADSARQDYRISEYGRDEI